MLAARSEPRPNFSVHEVPLHDTFLTGVGMGEGSAQSMQPPAPFLRLASRNELIISLDSDLSRPLAGLAARSFGSLPLGVDRGRIMRETLSDLRFSSAAERRSFCEVWRLDTCARLLTTFTWLSACDARFWPVDDDEESLRRRCASDETLRPALAVGYAQLLTEQGVRADVKDVFAFYLPEALAFGARRALRLAFPRSSAQLRHPDLPQHLFSSVAKLMSAFGHGRIPGASPLRSIAPAPGNRCQGSSSDMARDWNVEQVCLPAECSLPSAAHATSRGLARWTSCLARAPSICRDTVNPPAHFPPYCAPRNFHSWHGDSPSRATLSGT